MKYSELREAFAPMPHETRQVIKKTLDNLRPAYTGSRSKLRFAPVLALLLALALLGTALAAMREQILVYLLGDQGQASPELTQMVQPLDVTGTADGVRVTLNGALCDGQRIAFSFEAENENPGSPAAVVLEDTMVHRERISGAFTSTATADSLLWVPSFRLDVLPVARNPAPGGMTAELQTPITEETISCTATFSIWRPRGKLVVADAGMLEDLSGLDTETRLEYEDQRKTIYCFDDVTIADAAHLDALQWAQQGYTVIDLSGQVYEGAAAAYERGEYAYAWTESVPFDALEKTGEVRLTFELAVTPVRELAFGDEIALGDCTARMNRLCVSPLSTDIAFDLIPAQNTREAAEALRSTYGWLEARDENDQPLSYQEMDYLYEGQGTVCEQDGIWLCRFVLDMPGLVSMPQAICLHMRANADERMEGSAQQAASLSAFNERMVFSLRP